MIKQDIDKIYLYAKDPYEAKYKLLTNKLKSICLTDFGAAKAFMNTQITWIIFIKILMNALQVKTQNFDHI